MINIFVHKHTPRIAYSFSLLFRHILKLEYRIEDTHSFSGAIPAFSLYYGPAPAPAISVWLPAGGLLFEEGIQKKLDIQPGFFQGKRVLFFQQGATNALLPFDLPAMVFYLASRYEEYQPFKPDKLGRFSAAESMAAKYNFLDQPVVNQWAIQLGEILEERFPGLSVSYPAYQVRSSFDIDFAWAYLNRPFWRTIGATLNDLRKGSVATLLERLAVLTRTKKDPFDVYGYLERFHAHLDIVPQFFLLLGDYSTYDKNVSYENLQLQQLIQSLSEKYTLGIHPSFQSNKVEGRLVKEIERLSGITGKEVKHSRQHFLMLEFPNTYHRLVEAGITDDYSMGFADEPGFRAGLASPFPWYDLSTEKEQPLMIHPFTLMDVTLQSYLQLSPEKAFAKAAQLCRAVYAVNGEFFILWHNSSFSSKHGWEGWREVFEKILSFAIEIE